MGCCVQSKISTAEGDGNLDFENGAKNLRAMDSFAEVVKKFSAGNITHYASLSVFCSSAPLTGEPVTGVLKTSDWNRDFEKKIIYSFPECSLVSIVSVLEIGGSQEDQWEEEKEEEKDSTSSEECYAATIFSRDSEETSSIEGTMAAAAYLKLSNFVEGDIVSIRIGNNTATIRFVNALVGMAGNSDNSSTSIGGGKKHSMFGSQRDRASILSAVTRVSVPSNSANYWVPKPAGGSAGNNNSNGDAQKKVRCVTMFVDVVAVPVKPILETDILSMFRQIFGVCDTLPKVYIGNFPRANLPTYLIILENEASLSSLRASAEAVDSLQAESVILSCPCATGGRDQLYDYYYRVFVPKSFEMEHKCRMSSQQILALFWAKQFAKFQLVSLCKSSYKPECTVQVNMITGRLKLYGTATLEHEGDVLLENHT